ncbi:hypothetical protein ACFL1E_01210 [Candidatus Omnitrophota bacterium]
MKALIFLLCACIMVCGCVTVKMPDPAHDDFPYNKVFSADFTLTLESTLETLRSLDWEVSEVSRSTLIKKDKTPRTIPQLRAYIFTNIKQRQFIITSTYSTINARVETIDEKRTAVSLRYLAMTPILPFFKEKINHSNDKLVKKIYKKIEEVIGTQER